MTTTRDYLDEIEAQLVERAPAVAASRPRQRRWERAAVLPALAAAAAIVVAIVLLSTSAGGPTPRHHAQPVAAPARHGHPHQALNPRPAHHRHSNPTAPLVVSRPAQPGGPVPRGFSPEAFTAISELNWWLLGTAPCSSPPCTSIVRTQDGGRSFAGIPAPRTTQVSQLRFADAEDGFAFGPALWVTHDGGAHWHQIGLTGQVAALEPARGYVYALYLKAGHGVLMRSPAGSDRWTTLYGAGDVVGGLWADGSDVLVEAATASRQLLMVSHDGGASFSPRPVPPSVLCHFEEKPVSVVWEACATGMMSGVWRSADGGAHFTAAGGDAGRSGLPQEPNSAAFAAASGSTAVYGFRELDRTTDGGAHWSAVPTPAGVQDWQYLGFTDATHGVAIGRFGSGDRLYYTTDAGASYHRVTIG